MTKGRYLPSKKANSGSVNMINSQSHVEDADHHDADQSSLESDADGAAEDLASNDPPCFSELQSELQAAVSSKRVLP